MHEHGNAPRPYCESDSMAVTLLPVLSEKGYWVELKHYASQGWKLHFGLYGPGSTEFGPKMPTISGAITAALLRLDELRTKLQ